jgi:putative PIN family toxin of toxin-antitoxin system
MVDLFDIKEFVALVRFRGEKIEPGNAIHVCRDPDDDKFLEIAIDGLANYIVSGDGDLLGLSPFRGIPIVKPTEFLDILAK